MTEGNPDLSKEDEKKVEAILQTYEEKMGKIPEIVKISTSRPDILIPMSEMAERLLLDPRVLDRKTAELVAVSAAVAIGCRPCIDFHMEVALNNGATFDELFEVIMISSLMAQSSVQAEALRVFQQQKKRAFRPR